jgi:hypothetical protein
VLTVHQAQQANHAAGKVLCDSMLAGLRRQAKHPHDGSTSMSADSDKENMSISISTSKCAHLKSMYRTKSMEQLGQIIDLMEKNEQFNQDLLSEAQQATDTNIRAIESQEHTNSVLLDILRQGLLGDGN